MSKQADIIMIWTTFSHSRNFSSAYPIVSLCRLDPAQKDALIDIISTMLGDNSTFTIGSVLMAFNQVCPDRLDLIHPQYRKLCKMLVDMDEWGQITAMDLLLRYSRYIIALY